MAWFEIEILDEVKQRGAVASFWLALICASFLPSVSYLPSLAQAQTVTKIGFEENSRAVDGDLEPLQAIGYEPLDTRPRLGTVFSPEGGESGRFLSPQNRDPFTQEAPVPKQPSAGGTTLNVRDAEIKTLVKVISQMTGRNYILDPAVRGKVTIYQPSGLTVSQTLATFESVLLHKGYTSVPIGNNTWKIVRAEEAHETTIPLLYESPEEASDALVTQLFKLQHVEVAEIEGVIKRFVSQKGSLSTFPATNSLIFVDSAKNIQRLQKLISRLDVPSTLHDVTVIPIRHALAKDIAEKINDILSRSKGARKQTQAVSSKIKGQPPRRRGRRFRMSLEQDTQKDKEASVFPDERTNSLIVMASVEIKERVEELVKILDSPIDRSGQFYVYELKYADAEELVEIINPFVSSGGQSNSSVSSASQGTSFSRRGLEVNSSTVKGENNSSGEGKVVFEGDVSVAAEPRTNSIVVNATPSDYLKIKKLINKLDVKRRQVIVEASIVEVSVDDEESLGLDLQGTVSTSNGALFAQSNFGNFPQFFQNPAAIQDLTLAAASEGTITLPGGLTLPSQAALINALSRNSKVNILSSPSIVTSDNDEAEIIVGENVPFVTSTSTDPTNLNNTFNQIERQDVGITLRITPQITNGFLITLDIFVEISNVVPGTRNDENGPTTTVRTTETTVVVKDNQMTVTGGLISNNVTEAERGIPVLMDIPYLGSLFKSTRENVRKTNLLIFITPRILKDELDAADVSQAVRKRMRNNVGDKPVDSLIQQGQPVFGQINDGR